MAKSLRELGVWQKSRELAGLLYRVTSQFPHEERYGLASQLHRAGISIASNIAEGSGRGTRSDHRSFLRMARGSALEVHTQLIIARDLGFGDASQITEAENLTEQISKMLWAIIQKTLTSPHFNLQPVTRNQ